MIAEAEALVGTKLRLEQWNYEASLDSIRHYAWGVGDDNPLWYDEEYAEKSRFGGIVAPPTFLYSCWSAAMGLGMVGLQPIYGGTKWEFYEPIRRGDRIKAEGSVGPIKVMQGGTANRFVMQTALCDYVRGDGAILARAEGRTFRIPRGEAEGGLSYKPRQEHQYTAEELDALRQQVMKQERRGPTPRYWEDVEPGEELQTRVKGPIDQLTMNAYYAGVVGSPAMKSRDLRFKLQTWAAEAPERVPNNYDMTFWLEATSPTLGHQIAEVAHQVGMPGRYANGAQKTAWMAHPVLDWMGDDGDLLTLESKLRRPDIYGDTVTCHASVTGKPEPGVVELELRADNQLGETTATGTASVRLPTK